MILSVLGGGTLAYAGFEYAQAYRNYNEYVGMQAEVNAGSTTTTPSDVNTFYQESVVPRGTRFYAASAVGGLFLASGVTMIIVF